MGKIFSFIFLLFFTGSLLAQNKVSCTQNGKVSNLICKQAATYENINGKISLSITTANNQLLELNNISENIFKNGQKLASKDFKMVLIDESINKTYTSKSTVQISIKYNNSSKTYQVTFSGMVNDKTNKMNISAVLFVKQSPRKNLKTN